MTIKKIRITEENIAAEQLIPPAAPDGSRIGVHYIDAYIKSLNTETEDGIQITCKRKGLKILLTIGDKSGEALIQRLNHGPDVRNMLHQALETAAIEAGAQLSTEDGIIYLQCGT